MTDSLYFFEVFKKAACKTKLRLIFNLQTVKDARQGSEVTEVCKYESSSVYLKLISDVPVKALFTGRKVSGKALFKKVNLSSFMILLVTQYIPRQISGSCRSTQSCNRILILTLYLFGSETGVPLLHSPTRHLTFYISETSHTLFFSFVVVARSVHLCCRSPCFFTVVVGF